MHSARPKCSLTIIEDEEEVGVTFHIQIASTNTAMGVQAIVTMETFLCDYFL